MGDHELNALIDDLPDLVIEDADTDSEEIINDSEHDTQSEQSGSDDESVGTSSSDFYIGRGARNNKKEDESAFMWRKEPYKPTKVKKKNIVKFREGLTDTSKDIQDEFDAFSKMFDWNLMETIVKCTNLAIQTVKQSGKYQIKCFSTRSMI